MTYEVAPLGTVSPLLLRRQRAGIEVVVEAEVSDVFDGDIARASVSEVRLVSCMETMALSLQRVISSAWAHGGHADEGTPSAAPVQLDLDLTQRAFFPLATLRPSPQTVCGLEVTWAPSGRDAAWGEGGRGCA